MPALLALAALPALAACAGDAPPGGLARPGVVQGVIVDDGAAGYVSPTPLERMARAARLPPCAGLPPVGAAWPEAPVRPVPGALRLPPGATDRPDEVPDDGRVQAWRRAGLGSLTVDLDEHASRSTGFSIQPGDPARGRMVGEGECALRVAGRRAPVRLYLIVWAPRAGRAGSDTSYVATTDVLFAPDSELGAGVSARSPAARDTLLAALGALRLHGR